MLWSKQNKIPMPEGIYVTSHGADFYVISTLNDPAYHNLITKRKISNEKQYYKIKKLNEWNGILLKKHLEK